MHDGALFLVRKMSLQPDGVDGAEPLGCATECLWETVGCYNGLFVRNETSYKCAKEPRFPSPVCCDPGIFYPGILVFFCVIRTLFEKNGAHWCIFPPNRVLFRPSATIFQGSSKFENNNAKKLDLGSIFISKRSAGSSEGSTEV